MEPEYLMIIANRKINEFEQQTENAELVKTLKESGKAQEPPFWRRLIGSSLIKLGQRLARTSITPFQF